MKIIAKISSSRVIVEMNVTELANIAGKDYENELHADSGNRYSSALEPGTTYEVSPAWKRLRHQKDAAKQLEQASASLAALSDLVKSVLPTVILVTGQDEQGGEK